MHDFEVLEGISYQILLLYGDVIAYPGSNPNTGLANLWYWKEPQICVVITPSTPLADDTFQSKRHSYNSQS